MNAEKLNFNFYIYTLFLDFVLYSIYKFLAFSLHNMQQSKVTKRCVLPLR